MKYTCTARLGAETELLIEGQGVVDLDVDLGGEVAIGVERVVHAVLPGPPCMCWRIVIATSHPWGSDDEPRIELFLSPDEVQALVQALAGELVRSLDGYRPPDELALAHLTQHVDEAGA